MDRSGDMDSQPSVDMTGLPYCRYGVGIVLLENKIVSSSLVDLQYIRMKEITSIVFALNPLIANHDCNRRHIL